MTNLGRGRTTKFNSGAISGSLKVSLSIQDGNKIVIDNLEGEYEVICNEGTNHVSFIGENQIIDERYTNWKVNPGAANYLPVLVDSSYQQWKGKTGYVGIRKSTINGDYIYGWLKITVSADGKNSYSDIMGVNPEPGSSITTGINESFLSYSTDKFVENDNNDSTIKNSIIATIHGDSFNKIGKLNAGTDFETAETPRGTVVSINVLDSKTAQISLVGTMTNATGTRYNWNVYRRNFRIKFLDNAFASNNASAIRFSEIQPKVEYVGDSFTEKLNLEPLNIDLTSFGSVFVSVFSATTVDGSTNAYGIQHYKPTRGARSTPGTKLITYRKDALANENYEVIPLDKGTLIDANSPWKNGNAFYTGVGQHLIDNDNYQAWRGKTKYVGMRYRKSGQFHYGWIELKVDITGKIFQFLSYGLNGTPSQGIKAGTLDTDTVVDPCLPSPKLQTNITNTADGENNGSIRIVSETAIISTTKISIDGGNTYPYQLDSNNATLLISDLETGTYNLWMQYNDDECSNLIETVQIENDVTDVDTRYCQSGKEGNNYITSVNIGTINNTSENSSYTDYTSLSTEVSTGTTVSLKVDLRYTTPAWDSNTIAAYVDWNQDNDFDDDGETVYLKEKSEGAGDTSFTIPLDAKLGSTRLRIRAGWFSIPLACQTDRNFETEDYTIVVIDKEQEVSGQVIYVDIADQSASIQTPWDFFRIEVGDNNKFGAWFNQNMLFLETYGKRLITQDTSQNIMFIDENQIIGKNSQFTTAKSQYVLTADQYKEWYGRSGYIGFSFEIDGKTHYGWFYAEVAKDGKSYSILDYAYNTAPGESLRTSRNNKSITDETDHTSEIKIYPNPFTTYTNLDISSLNPQDTFTIIIYDISGKKVLTDILNNTENLNQIGTSLNTNGVYFMKINSENFVKTFKLIKR